VESGEVVPITVKTFFAKIIHSGETEYSLVFFPS